ncbi:MAG: TIR domain-containing protein [bacterium]|nr:TIR domain-containing protein [bacterium]
MAFDNWDKLLYGIRRGECILFLGPDVAANDGQRDRVPADLLAERFKDRLMDDGVEGGAAEGLAAVAQRLRIQDPSNFELEMSIDRWHEEVGGWSSDLHAAMAALPFRHIVTSCHDPLMEQALVAAGKRPTVSFYHYRGAHEDLVQGDDSGPDTPVLYHLYGHVKDKESLVLTERELLDFLAALSSKNPKLPHDLSAALSEARCFLFLGFGLKHWYLRILLHVLKVLRRSGLAFVSESLDGSGQDGFQNTVLFYSESFGRVQVYEQDMAGFLGELRDRYVATKGPEAAAPVTNVSGGGAVPPAVATADGEDDDSESEVMLARAEPGGDRATVFICHASENAEIARRIHDELERKGLDPWLDKDDLRGGDQWSPLIEKTIDESDFFLLLNSAELAAKTKERAFVNKEINIALESKKWRRSEYIVPVCLDKTPLDPVFEKYQHVDMTQDDGMKRLVRALKRRDAEAEQA